jgi:hypothetical protein
MEAVIARRGTRLRWLSGLSGQQVPERVSRHVDLRPLAPLASVVAGPISALRGRLDRAAVEDGGRRLRFLADGEPQDGAEVMDDGLEAVSGGSADRPSPGGKSLGR